MVGAAWTLVPALLRAYYGVNEIITTLMMTFIGINLANILIKGPFQDIASNVPQTEGDPLHEPAADDPGHAHPRRASSSPAWGRSSPGT